MAIVNRLIPIQNTEYGSIVRKRLTVYGWYHPIHRHHLKILISFVFERKFAFACSFSNDAHSTYKGYVLNNLKCFNSVKKHDRFIKFSSKDGTAGQQGRRWKNRTMCLTNFCVKSYTNTWTNPWSLCYGLNVDEIEINPRPVKIFRFSIHKSGNEDIGIKLCINSTLRVRRLSA